MDRRRRRRRVEPTEDWEQLELLCRWPEQLAYEEIRPLTLFGASVAERARETGSAERTLYRRVGRFEEEGMESLFGAQTARRRRLPPAMRRLVVDLKAEYPGFNPNEIANAVYVRFGRRPDRKTVGRVLEEEPIPLRFVRRFPPYHEIPELRERRLAVVTLHSEGWSSKAVAGYLRAHKATVHRVLKRWAEEGPEGLEDRRPGRPPEAVRGPPLASPTAALRAGRARRGRLAEGHEARRLRPQEPPPSRGVAAGAVRPPRGLGLRRHASGADAIREGVGEQTLRPDFTAPGA